jgi:hypothetical protein
MHRRNMLWGAVSAIGAAFAASRAGAATEPAAQAKLKVVYHLNDLDKVNFLPGSIQNHLDGVGGPDHAAAAVGARAPSPANDASRLRRSEHCIQLCERRRFSSKGIGWLYQGRPYSHSARC